jgi:hypothetical protein
VRPSGAKQSHVHRPQKKASIQIDSDDAPLKNGAGGKPKATEPSASKEAQVKPNAQQARWSNRGPPPGLKQEGESIDL